MAKIEMDISEYEIMKENKVLLEKALEKERSLHEQIKKLNEEKMYALLEAKMKVVKTVETTSNDYIYEVRPDSSSVWMDIYSYFGVRNNNNNFTHDLSKIVDLFFRKTNIKSEPKITVTTHGLDDIKKEIKAKVESKISLEQRNKLESAEIAIKENDDLRNKHFNYEKTIKGLIKENDELLNSIDELQEDVRSRIIDSNKVIDVMRILSDNIGFSGLFGNKKKIDEIRMVINKSAK